MSVHGKSAKMHTGKRCLHKDLGRGGGGGGGAVFEHSTRQKTERKQVHSKHFMPKHLEDFFFRQ